jgi:beta-glucanase (GH16 family)
MLTKHLTPLILLVVATTSSAQTFRENFSEGLISDRWKVSTWTAPRHSPTNLASFDAKNVEVVDGMLRIRLTQKKNADGSITSVGGELMTVQSFGYGTYTLVMKSSSDSDNEAVNGSITGAGPYLNLSETEIDIEMEGFWPRAEFTQLTTWTDEKTDEKTLVEETFPYKGFHTYKIVWTSKSVQLFFDNKIVATHKTVVPSKPAPFLLNHWGTNDAAWGGLATPDVERYVYVKSFTFTPILEKP